MVILHASITRMLTGLILFIPSSICVNNFDSDLWMTTFTYLFKNTTTVTCDITTDIMIKTFEFSGKELFSIGQERQCLEYNMSYNLLVLHKLDLPSSVSKQEIISAFFEFLNLSYFYYGFCVPLQCQSTFSDILREDTTDQVTRDNLISLLMNSNTDFDFTIALYARNNNTKGDIVFDFNATNPFYWLLIAIIIIVCIRVIIEIIGFFLYKRKKNKEEEEEQDQETEMTERAKGTPKSDGLLFPDEIIFNESVINDIDGVSSPRKQNSNRLSLIFLDEKPSYFRSFYNICSFVNCFKILMEDSNFYYDERGMKMISFFQVYLLFWLTFNHSLYTMLIIPSQSIIQSKEFFESIWLFLIKYSVFASDLWVALDGLLTAFKLMSFIKTHSTPKQANSCTAEHHQRIPFKKFIFFYLYCLPRMFAFYTIFFLFYYYAENLSLFFRLPSFFQVFSHHLILCRECISNLSIIINPFNIYFTNNAPLSRANSYCFKFATVYLNEWISFTLMMIIFYTSSLLKHSAFDIIVLVVFSINMSLKFLTYLPKCGYKLGYMSLDYIFGSDCSLKYPHLMINIYFTGFLFGMALFYYKDSTKANSLQSSNAYKPFNYCFKVVMCIDRCPLWAKNVVLILAILVQILASLSVIFFIHFHSNSVDINSIIQIVDCYEKDVFRVCFLVMILIIDIYPKETLINHITAYGFAQISRMGFCYYCFMDVFIYLFFTLFRSEFQISYSNGVCLTIGLIFFLLIFNMFLVIAFELPVRMIFKNIRKLKESSDKEAVISQ